MSGKEQFRRFFSFRLPIIFLELTMQEARDHLRMRSNELETGYKNCRTAVNSFYRNHLWVVGNLPGHQRRSLDAILYHGIRTAELLNLESLNNQSLEVWREIRDDLNDAFEDNDASPELAALVDVARKHDIPPALLLEPISAADSWIRNRKFETFKELEYFAGQIGGSLMAATIPVLGFVSPDYQCAAIECGKGLLLTQILAECVNDIKFNKTFLAQQDLDDCNIEIHRLKLRQGGPPLKHLVRLYCWRIEKILLDGAGKLIPHLDYDARRSVTSLLALYWRTLMRMQLEPESVLNESGVLSRRDLLRLKSRHLLGIEGDAPIITGEQPHHH
jgi:phytoene/squalene synthetase